MLKGHRLQGGQSVPLEFAKAPTRREESLFHVWQ